MRRQAARRLLAAGVTTSLAAAIGVTALTLPGAQAAETGPTGFATQNGGTTGGAGGAVVKATTGTQIHEALCGRASDDTPITIQVEGTINHGNTSKVSGDSCNTADGVIELKQISNVTLVGVGGGATFDQLGIHIREASNIIIQNVTVKNVKKSGSPTSNGGDAIGMESGVSNVWVDHVTLEASGGESEGYDGLFDMKGDTNYVTLSYSILRGSGRGGLVGSGDSDLDNGPVTYHHNLYENIDSRLPLLRGATAHIYNNHYVDIHESGINARAGGKAKVDNNYFQDSKDVLGTFYTDLPGYWQVAGNTFDNVTWSEPGEDNNPAGPNPTSTTSVSVPYDYSLDDADCVPDVVAATAGAGTGLKVSDGSCEAQTPTDPPTDEPTDPPTDEPTDPTGTNLSLGAGADGSSKASGSSYGNVVDGNLSTSWSPSSSTGRVSVKWGTPQTVAQVKVVEAAGSEGTITGFRIVNHDNGAVLATGSRAGVVNLPSTTLSKLDLEITGASGTPKVAELETYAGQGSTDPTDPAPTDPPTDPTDPTDPEPTDPPTPSGEVIYAAPDGSAGAAGTEADPTTIAAAIAGVEPGGAIYLRGGQYDLADTLTIEPGNDGTSSERTLLSAYPGEKPVLDFSAQAEDSANRGLAIGGNFWHVYGITVQNSGDNGILLGGDDNVIERVVTRGNADTGLQIARLVAGAPKSEWPSDNLVLSSESYDNVDSDGEDADGFAAKLTVGEGNVFRDCVAHNNIDDGWDLYAKDETGPIGVVTIEHSLSYENGTLSDGSQAGSGDRNGFKLGGSDIAVDHVIRDSIAYDNGHHGFTYNSNPGSITVTDNVGIGSAERNFAFDEGSHKFSGNVSCGGGSNDKLSGSDDGTNAWNGTGDCGAYDGALDWSFAADGSLEVTFG